MHWKAKKKSCDFIIIFTLLQQSGTKFAIFANLQRKGFPEMESAPGEDTVKTVEMRVKNLEYYIDIVD